MIEILNSFEVIKQTRKPATRRQSMGRTNLDKIAKWQNSKSKYVFSLQRILEMNPICIP